MRNSFHENDTAQKMKFFIKDFFNKCDRIRSFLDLVAFTEEILNGKLHFCAVWMAYTSSLMFSCFLKKQIASELFFLLQSLLTNKLSLWIDNSFFCFSTSFLKTKAKVFLRLPSQYSKTYFLLCLVPIAGK